MYVCMYVCMYGYICSKASTVHPRVFPFKGSEKEARKQDVLQHYRFCKVSVLLRGLGFPSFRGLDFV